MCGNERRIKKTNLIYRNKNLRYMINDMAFEYDILPIQFTICMIYYFMVLLRIGLNIVCSSAKNIPLISVFFLIAMIILTDSIKIGCVLHTIYLIILLF